MILVCIACSTVENIKDTAIDTVDGVVPIDLKGKDETIFGAKDYAVALVSRVQPKWFVGSEKFSLRNLNSDAPAHLFYDITPDLNFDSYKVNFVVTTPEASDKAYQIDIVSGQHFVDKTFCEQTDISRKYKKTIEFPPYTSGIVPRLLDQLGEPQKIIVFGDKNFYTKNYRDHFFDTRVVGGFIERVCRFGACTKFKDLSSRVVLVGVQAGNEKYEKVRSIEDLRLVVDWNEVRAFVENGFGKNTVGGAFYPGFKMGSELSAIQAMTTIKKNSIYLSNKKLNKMRQSCHRLYDYVWKNIAPFSKEEKKLLSLKKVNERRAYYRKISRSKDALFYRRFIGAYRRYEAEYKTCVKYVYPSNVHYDPERHWFLTYYTAVHLLNDLGYSFDCTRSLWIKNPVDSDGKRTIKTSQEFRGCDARKIDMAFEYAINFMENLRFKSYPAYRYVDYDRHAIGTHQKLYSWVPQNNKKLECYGKQEDKAAKLPTYPSDIKWKRRNIEISNATVVK